MEQRKGFSSIFYEKTYQNYQQVEENSYSIDNSTSDEDTGGEQLRSESRNLVTTLRTPGAKRHKVHRKPLSDFKIKRKTKTRTELNVKKQCNVLCANNSIKAKTQYTTSRWDKVTSAFKSTSSMSARQLPFEQCSALAATTENPKSLPDNMNQTPIEWSFSDDENHPKSSPSHKSTSPITELDELLALIEKQTSKENPINKIKQTPKRAPKRRRSGGYVHQLQRTLERAKTDAKYLEPDKKIVQKCGTQLRVLDLENSFGVCSAKVQAVDDINAKPFRVILKPNMAQNMQVGCIMESFFEILPHVVAEESIYVQPNKLLLL